MNNPRLLSKSKFKLGCECPTKLFYSSKKEYINNNLENEFLQALAEGGYQVGELAKAYFPGGIDIDTLDYEEALSLTKKHMAKDEVILYEPAFMYKNLFVRVDVLVKKGSKVYIYEVKAKSFDINDEKNQFFNMKKDEIRTNWKPYIYDIAFQNYVVSQALGEFEIFPYLTLSDKTAICSVDGLNQKFPISKDENGRLKVEPKELNEKDLEVELLINIPVKEELDFTYENTVFEETKLSFIDNIWFLANMYEKNEKITPQLSSKCKNCEFKYDDDYSKSGFHKCWSDSLGWSEKEFEKPLVLELWYGGVIAQNMLDEERYFLEDISEDDFKNLESNNSKLTRQQRQFLQVQKVKESDDSVYFDKESISKEIDSWNYPLHCIDFETMTNAIPFNKNLYAYESIAFQFSHHIIYDDGRVKHKGEYINTTVGKFPNFEFIRALKKELENDNGTIFMYHHHENTILNHIYTQLENSNEIDKDELQEFILSITFDRGTEHISKRCMVDLLKLVQWYYYDPVTKNSNSIKYVLPAIINRSKYLQEKYSKPIYGTEQMNSLNFKNFTWIQKDENETIKDPYKLLPKIFEDIDNEDEKKLLLSDNDGLRNGAAAMTAYARMQFSHMSKYERDKLKKALLKYCELDTFAMVLILEEWIQECK